MNYHNITKDDMLNGEGLRIVLWLSGCEHHCPECQNPQTWDPKSGIEFDAYALIELLEDLDHDYISGLTLSGGDPFHKDNLFGTAALCGAVRLWYPSKTIWIYTGYLFEDLLNDPDRKDILNSIDILVDGRFEKDKADVKYCWAGSTNQRVIDVPKSLKEGTVILHREEGCV